MKEKKSEKLRKKQNKTSEKCFNTRLKNMSKNLRMQAWCGIVGVYFGSSKIEKRMEENIEGEDRWDEKRKRAER